MAADDAELRALLDRLERGIAETAAKLRSGGNLIAVGSVVVAGVAAAEGKWVLVPICLVFGGAIFGLMRGAVKRTGPARSAPVLAALRDAPERVRSISHKVTSDSRRMFSTHWIEVKTDDGRLFIRAEDWAELLERLAQRCPQAAVARGD